MSRNAAESFPLLVGSVYAIAGIFFMISEANAQDCSGILSNFRESFYFSENAASNEAAIDAACQDVSAQGGYGAAWGGGSYQECKNSTRTKEQTLQLIQQASTIRAAEAVDAYRACLNAQNAPGFYAWYEKADKTENGPFTVHFKAIAPYKCKPLTVPDAAGSQSFKCANHFRVLIYSAGPGLADLPSKCPGRIASTKFEDVNQRFVNGTPTPAHPDIKEEWQETGREITVTCNGKAPGPLILTFEDSTDWSAPTPSVLVIP